MHFEIEHFFDAPVEAVEAAMFHPEYNTFLIERSDLLTSAALKAFEDDGMRIARRVLLAPRPAFDHIGAKKIEPQWFEFVEESTWDRRARTLTFENLPTTEKVRKRIINRGEVTLESQGPLRTRRIARCEIRVHSMPLLVRPFIPLVEQMLVREAKRMLDGEAQVMREWLATRRGQQPIIQA